MNIVQIGTNHGDDHVRDLALKNEHDLILLVEPFSVHNNSIVKNYSQIKNYIIENVAIDGDINDGDTIHKNFYYSEDSKPSIEFPGRNFMTASLHPSHVRKHGLSNIKEIKVSCISINTLFDKYNLHTIDYLFIDAEGSDLGILKSINFDKYEISNIQMEKLHIDRSELNKFMNSKNYYISNNSPDSDGYDILFSKKLNFTES